MRTALLGLSHEMMIVVLRMSQVLKTRVLLCLFQTSPLAFESRFAGRYITVTGVRGVFNISINLLIFACAELFSKVFHKVIG